MALTSAAHLTIEQRAGRAAVVGALIGFVGVTVAVGALGLANGLGGVSAFGLAVFVATFSGVGFGAMVAASLVAAREHSSGAGHRSAAHAPDDRD
jgi:hypothetical protein